MKYISNLDFLGSTHSLTINKNPIFQNYFGGLISILVIISTVSSAIYFGKDIWERKNSIVNTSFEGDPSPSQLKLDKERWDFFFGLQYKNKLFIDDSIYTVKSRLFTYTSEKGFEFQDFKTEACTEKSFTEKTFFLFNEYNFKGGRCISHNQTTEIMINKLGGQDDFKYIDISLYPCKNSSTNNTNSTVCKSKDVIDDYLKIGVFDVYTIYYNIQNQFLNPHKAAIYNDFYPVSSARFTHSIIFLSHSIVKSDVGWLMEELIEERGFNINRIKSNLYTKPEDDLRFVRFQFQLGNTIAIYSRKYMKLQELCAQIGGITKFLVLLGRLICYIDKTVSFQIYLVNQFFDEEVKGKEGKNISKRIGKININSQYDKDFSDDNLKNNHRELNQINNYVKSQGNLSIHMENTLFPSQITYPTRSKLSLSIFKRHFFYFCPNKSLFLKLKSGFSLLDRCLSIEQHIQNTREVRKIRFFLFSNYENDVLDRIGNPILKDKNEDYSIRKTGLNDENNSEFTELYSFINKDYDSVKESVSYSEDYLNNINMNRESFFNRIVNTYKTRPLCLNH